MPFAMIRHQVKDFDQWKSVFDANAGWRKEQGETHYYVFRDVDHPDTIIVLLDFANMETAKRFMQLPSLQEKMMQSGVTGDLQITFVEEMESTYKS